MLIMFVDSPIVALSKIFFVSIFSVNSQPIKKVESHDSRYTGTCCCCDGPSDDLEGSDAEVDDDDESRPSDHNTKRGLAAGTGGVLSVG